ncbi:MAG TPA: CoA transferase [Candidatus Methylomirabilis sp.]|nr:CoA transferase [Candidatus Methylomirabilis sp.]
MSASRQAAPPASVEGDAISASAALAGLWATVGGEARALGRATLTGSDPLLPTDFPIATAAAAAIGAGALAAAELWRLRTGREQSVSVDARAAVAAFRSERYLRVDGQLPPDVRGGIFGFYRTSDGRFVQIHGALPHHREGILRCLGAEPTRESVAGVIAEREGQELEDTLAADGLPAGLVRSRAEWWAHEQGRAVAGLPLLEIERIGDAPPAPLPASARPLGGVRVADLTRVIAGPVCGRTLASYGAEVMLVTAPHLANAPALVMDTGFGKLSASLDLRRPEHAEQLRAIVRQSDVFCQGYRPGALARLGFAPEDVLRLRPGIVCVTLSAYGHAGPWRERRGFETLIQSVSGMADEQGRAAGLDRPQHLPAQVVDHGTGYLAALGAMIALARRHREGGSYLVRVSLAQTGRWVDGLGRVGGRATADLSPEDIADLLADADTPFGRLRHVIPPARFSETPAFWSRPAVPLGTHEPLWPSPTRP